MTTKPSPEITVFIARRDVTCRKYSGRVGRTAAAKKLDAAAVCLAAIAHVRHTETNYDQLLSQGYDRRDARAKVEGLVARVLARWSGNT